MWLVASYLYIFKAIVFSSNHSLYKSSGIWMHKIFCTQYDALPLYRKLFQIIATATAGFLLQIKFSCNHIALFLWILFETLYFMQQAWKPNFVLHGSMLFLCLLMIKQSLKRPLPPNQGPVYYSNYRAPESPDYLLHLLNG